MKPPADGGAPGSGQSPNSGTQQTYHASGTGWWPQGNPAELIAAADAWDAAADAIDVIIEDGARIVAQVVAVNTSDAVDGFAQFWTRYDKGTGATAPGSGAILTDQAGAARQLALACRDYAHRITTAKAEILALRAAEVTIAVAGLALAIFTIGASVAEAAAAEAATVAAVDVIEQSVIRVVLEIIGRIAASAAAGAAFGGGYDVISQAIHGQYDPNYHFDWHELLGETGKGAAAGAVVGGVAEGTVTSRADANGEHQQRRRVQLDQRAGPDGTTADSWAGCVRPRRLERGERPCLSHTDRWPILGHRRKHISARSVQSKESPLRPAGSGCHSYPLAGRLSSAVGE